MAIDTERLKKLIEEEDKKVSEDEDYLRKIIDPEDMDEESGIRSLNKRMASDPDPKAERNNLKENLSREYFGKELNELSEDDVILIENMIDEMTVKKKGSGSMKMAYEPGDYNKDNYDPMMVEEYEKYKYEMNEQRPGMPIMSIDEFIRMEKGSAKRKAPTIKMAEYNPGDYDPLIVDEYEKYKYDMNEQRPGMDVMSIDEFLRMARAGAMGGGIMRAMYNKGTDKEKFLLGNLAPQAMKGNEMREFMIMNPGVEDVADYKGYYMKLKKEENEIKKMLDKAKKEKIKRAKGGIAGI